MWYQESTFYQLYTLGFCGAPQENDGIAQARIQKVEKWIPHLTRLGVGAVYFCPVFECDSHGYDTRDYRKVDCRLGTNAEFAGVCRALHNAGMRVVLDGVFNHVGRGFWAFEDVRKRREASPYRDWFHIDFHRDSPYGDGFYYEGWEGHYNLVKLNLNHPDVVQHLLDCVRGWVEAFDIDGLRLDVAYLLDEGFLRALRSFTDALKPDFFLLGEILHGDYKRIVNGGMLHSCTNYECFKGIHSSLNEGNMHEIAYSLNRQFGPEHWTLYKGLHLLSFVDNHDVDRLASVLKEERNLPLAYTLQACMPGIPCLYYGSEWSVTGRKEGGSDSALRPCPEQPEWNALTDHIAALAAIRRNTPALLYGSYRQLYVASHQLAFLRELDDARVIVALNAANTPAALPLGMGGAWTELLTETTISHTNFLTLGAYSAGIYMEQAQQ